MAQLERELKSIESSPAFKKEIAVKRSLARLMKKHSCSKSDLITLLKGDESAPVKRGNSAAKKTRKPRMLKIFRNPETGETVETRGGNHRMLKAWKAKYKLDSLDDWLVETKD